MSAMAKRPLTTERTFGSKIDQVFRQWKHNLLFAIAFCLPTGPRQASDSVTRAETARWALLVPLAGGLEGGLSGEYNALAHINVEDRRLSFSTSLTMFVILLRKNHRCSFHVQPVRQTGGVSKGGAWAAAVATPAKKYLL
jgi:hypothetical protein